MDNFGRAIQTLRKKKGYTQSDLAASLNVSGQAVSKWENNLSQPDLDTMKKMVKIFDVSWDEFMALCEGNEDAENTAQKESAEEAKAEIASAAEKAVRAADEATAAANETKRMVSEASEKQAQLIGLCSFCSHAIYKKEHLAIKRPKIVCTACAEKYKRRELQLQRSERSDFKKILIIPAVLLGIIALISCIVFLTKGQYLYAAGVWLGAFLIYLPIPQIIWCEGIVSDICSATCGRTIRMPGIIFELDIDGIAWAIAVKIGLWILSAVLGLLLSAVGYTLCMIVAPFAFIPAYREEKRTIDARSVFTDEKIVSGLNSLNNPGEPVILR